MKKYTMETLKEDLPPVKVNLGDSWGIKECPAYGRKEKFAGVMLPLGYIHISWECYLRCVNEDRPVQL